MSDVSPIGDSHRSANPHLSSTTGPDGLPHGADPALKAKSRPTDPVGWGFISLYTFAFIGTNPDFLAPLLVTLALKVNSLVGIEQAPKSLAVVAGTGSLLAMVANPFFAARCGSPEAAACRPGGPSIDTQITVALLMRYLWELGS
jgi:hypothetical protein